MTEIVLRRIDFGSFAKLLAIIASLAGLCCGVCFFLSSLAGANVYVHFNDNYIRGPAAGAIGLVVVPIVFGFCGLFMAVVTYLPLKLLLKLTNGLRMSGEWHDPHGPVEEPRDF